VVGIVTSGMTNAQNINYAAPIVESMVIIRRIIYCFVHNKCVSQKITPGGKTVMDYLPYLNCSFTRANSVLLKSINDTCSTGMYCTGTHSSVKEIQEGDIVCKMSVEGREYDIDLQMSVKFDFWDDRLPMEALLDRLHPGSQMELHYWRNNELSRSKVRLTRNKSAFREYCPELETVPYVSRGGIFIMPLSHNHIPLFQRQNLYTLMNRPKVQEMSLPLITRILAESPFHESETTGAGDIVVAVNNRTITSVADFDDAFTKEMQKSDLVTIRCRDGSLATASTKSIVSVENKIKSTYDDAHVGLYE
jgi:hypothetical protein